VTDPPPAGTSVAGRPAQVPLSPLYWFAMTARVGDVLVLGECALAARQDATHLAGC